MKSNRDIALQANALEESIYYFQTFGQALKAHNNSKVAKLFYEAADTLQKELELLLGNENMSDLPKIAPWETLYEAYEHPSQHLMDVHYEIDEVEAKQIINKILQNSHVKE